MKAVSELSKNIPIGSEKQAKNSGDDFAAKVVSRVVSDLMAISPAWRTAIPDAAALESTQRSFMITMREMGVNNLRLVGKGLAKARKSQSDFFPSPGKFCAWCLEDDAWIEAYQRLMNRKKPKNTLERFVFGEIAFDLRFLTDDKARARFEACYRKWKDIERRGKLPEELTALPTKSVMSDFDKKRNSSGVPDPEKLTGVYARIAALGKRGEDKTRGNDQ